METIRQNSGELNNHEKMLQRILSSISCGVIQHNKDTKELILVNEAALQILGYKSKAEMIQDNFDGVAGTVEPEDRKHIHELIDSLNEPDVEKSYEYRVRHKNGDLVYCYGSLSMFYNDEGERIIQRNVMDITEKMEKSRQLQDMMTMHFQMVGSLSCGVFAYTIPEREILIFNTEAKRLFNYDENSNKTIGEVINEYIFPEDLEKVSGATSELKKVGDSCRYKYRFMRNDTVLTVECNTKLLAFADGSKFILSVLQDVTEKEYTEYMLKRERQQYRDAVITNAEYDFSFDVTQGYVCEDVKYRNGSRFSEVFGIEYPIHYDDLVKAWKKVKKPEMITSDIQNQNSTRDLIRQYENGNVHISSEYFVPDENKYYRRIALLSRDDVTGHIMGIIFSNDITDVVRESVRNSNELAAINRNLTKQMEITKSFSSIYFASWEINLETMKINPISVPDWAGSVVDKSGGNYRKALNVLIDDFVTDDYKKYMSDFLNADTLQQRINEEKILACEYLGRVSGWVSGTFIPSKQDDWGVITNVIFAVRNVDAEKKKELNAKKALQAAYEAANRASTAKTDFLASMSHDIRTPMNAIIGMTVIAGNHLDDRERIKDCLDKITVSSNHLLGLINEVLDMNKIESGNLELAVQNIHLPELIDNLIIMSKPQIEEKNHEFTFHMNNVNHENVIGDSMRIQQILMNVISNAVKYTPDGGKIKLTVGERSTNNNRVGCYEFIIEDNGIGMSEDFLSRLFEPFSRAKDTRVEKAQGTGLGMAITKNLVNMMNGNVKVESKLGEGTKFTITIFLKLQNTNQARNCDDADGETQDGVNKNSKTIEKLQKKNYKGKRALLVEDNELNAEIAMEIIGMTGLEIEWTENGKLAVEKMRQVEPGYYDIIFMDIQMPIMNGYEATMAIREIPEDYAKNVPIIAMTANAFAEDVRASRNAGMNEHIAKPLDLAQLLATLDKWVDISY